MNPEHISSTTPRSSQPTPIRRRPEDNDKFSAAHWVPVSGALAWVDRLSSKYARGKIGLCLDRDDFLEIRRGVLLWATKDRERMEWFNHPNSKPGTVTALIEIAIIEDILGNQCPDCLGQRWVGVGKDQHKCKRCGGRGLSTWTNSDRAKLLNIKKGAFERTWARRLREVRRYLSDQFEVPIQRLRL